MARIREYKLYSYGQGSAFSEYARPKPWIVQVRAKSIKQAYWLVANGVVCPGLLRMPNGSLQPRLSYGVGITFVDHSYGPEMVESWSFSFDISEVGNYWGL